jgi:hypothetical protein
MHGGSHSHPNVSFSGDRAHPGSELLRASFPEHFVTRCDPCEDFGDEGCFDRISPVLLNVAKD